MLVHDFCRDRLRDKRKPGSVALVLALCYVQIDSLQHSCYRTFGTTSDPAVVDADNWGNFRCCAGEECF